MTAISRPRIKGKTAAIILAAALATGLSACGSASSSSHASSITLSNPKPTTTSTPSTAPPPITLPVGTVATGSVTCSVVTGSIAFDPPLSLAARNSAPETARLSLHASQCSTTGSSTLEIAGATVTGSILAPVNSCGRFLGLPAPVAVAVAWSPNSVHASVASFSDYIFLVDPTGHAGFGFPGTGGTANVTGSFGGTDGGKSSTVSFLSSLTNKQFLAQCATTAGVSSMSIVIGTLTLS